MSDGPLPEPEVIGCYFDDGFTPPLAAMLLSWPGARAREWDLPGGVCRHGPPPVRFGLQVRRLTADRYTVRLVWDDDCFQWSGLARAELASGILPLVLAALGSDLAALTEQPIDAEDAPALVAA
jgi:hypothetical protein